MRSLSVRGLGLWTPGLPTLDAWTTRTPAPVADPPCAGIPSLALRGTGPCTRIAVEVALQAMRAAGADLVTTPTVFASSLGEIQTAVVLIDLVDTTGASSPIRFKNSVHNSSGGNFAVALHNRAFSTSLSGGHDLVAMALLEAWGWLDAHGGDVVVAFAEESVPAPLPDVEPHPPLGLALHLSTSPVADGAPTLSAPRRLGAAAVDARRPPHVGHGVAWALPLVEALAARRSGTVPLGSGDDPWCVTVV